LIQENSRSGKRKAKKVGTREAAEQVRKELEARLVLGNVAILSQTNAPTLAQFSQQWLQLYAEVECKRSTAVSYGKLLRLYLYPRFGDRRLTEIRRDDVKKYLALLVAEGKLSRNTLRLIVCTLRVIFTPRWRMGLWIETRRPD
jgi:hypothetical protein